MSRASDIPLDHRDRAPLLAQLAATGTSSSALSGSPYAKNMLTQPAPPPIGSGATAGVMPARNLLAPGTNVLAAPAAQTPPAAAIPSQQSPTPSPAPADDADQQLVALEQQLDAAKLTPAQIDQHAGTYADAVHHLGALVQKGAGVTHDDVIRQALYAVQGGSIAPDVAARFVENMKGPPQQLQGKLQQAVANTMLTNVALAALKQKMGGAAPPGAPQQTNQPVGSQS